jgi:hypothetical protein
MAKKKTSDQLTPAELGSAEAAGMTPAEYQAAYPGGEASQAAGEKAPAKAGPKGGNNSASEIASLKKQLGQAQSKEQSLTEEDAYQALAEQQAQQYLQSSKNLDPLTSGAALPAIEGTASANASQMLGASSTSPVSQWLNAQTQAAQAQNAPAAAAEQQVAGAQDQAAGMLATGLTNMGQAEKQMMAAAPYQQLLASLAQEVPYHLASGYSVPGMTQANTPQWLQQTEANVGVQSLPASSGSSNAAKGLLPPPTATGSSPVSTLLAPTTGTPAGQ